LKDTSVQAVKALLAKGIDIHMLTGDNEVAARHIASATGIRNVKAHVLPQDKAEYVRQLQAAGKRVAMVGDGINDSAALAQADLGIAMGQGSDIAIDTAQVTIVSSDLSKLRDLIRLSKRTVTVIRENLFWAFIYNVLAVPIAAGILYPFTGFLLNPMVAAACMALSSVCVVSNSLRLRK
jgi:Cu2+-exporting ATPase